MKSSGVLCLLVIFQLAESWLCSCGVFRPVDMGNVMEVAPMYGMEMVQPVPQVPGPGFPTVVGRPLAPKYFPGPVIPVVPLVQKITVEHRHVHVYEDKKDECDCYCDEKECERPCRKRKRKAQKDSEDCALCGVCKSCNLPDFLKNLDNGNHHHDHQEEKH